MTVHACVLLLLSLAVLTLASLLAGIIGFGVARWGGASIPHAVGRGGIASLGTMTVGVALLGVVVSAALCLPLLSE